MMGWIDEVEGAFNLVVDSYATHQDKERFAMALLDLSVAVLTKVEGKRAWRIDADAHGRSIYLGRCDRAIHRKTFEQSLSILRTLEEE
jgi:polysaccharide deacetylase 2 family uncharacterized protein YibQ